MESTKAILRCRYSYDPLDRLISQLQPDASAHQRFYCKSRLATEIQGAIGFSVFQNNDLLLAQSKNQGGAVESTLLATDLQRSVLHTLTADQQQHPIAYSLYGHHQAESGLTSLLGFNGERPDPVTGHYLLGNGYRAFNPVLMRFNSPDNLSPFGRGGLNSYSYCLGDPINFLDPNGHITLSIRQIVLLKGVVNYLQKLKNARKFFSVNGTPLPLKPGAKNHQIIEAAETGKSAQNKMNSIQLQRNNLFTNDFNNRRTPSLKNTAVETVQKHGLSVSETPKEVQVYAKTPALPRNSSDLLETITLQDGYDERKLSSMMASGQHHHTSGRIINPDVIRDYNTRINFIQSAEFDQAKETLSDTIRSVVNLH
jgi:RHS repeat-associated protein